MQTATSIVYKYFDLLDGFIKVRLVKEDQSLSLPNNLDGPPDRREYRHLVVASCVLQWQDVISQVQRLYPEDAAIAEDLLYQICIDLNPHLEIHSVALPVTTEFEALPPHHSTEHTGNLKKQAGKLASQVRQDVIGQDDAVEVICKSIRKAACGLNDPQRPIGTFLLVGGTGCGKTELAKSLARNWNPGHDLVRIDCSEYALPHESAKLIGAPPGYIGHSDGGVLTEALKKNERAVVLFDEIEKGHEKVHNMLLQILDEGRLTDSKGETVSFRNALILLTSNVGTADYAAAKNRLGFENPDVLAPEAFEDLTKKALQRTFKPELLNRFDQILTFNRLNKEDCTQIAAIQLRSLRERVKRAGVLMRWTASATRQLAATGFSPEYGARELRRTITRLVEDPLSHAIIEGDLKPGDAVTIRTQGGKVNLDWAE